MEEGKEVFAESRPRIPDPGSIDPRRGRKTRVKARGTDTIQFSREDIDISGLEQLIHQDRLIKSKLRG